MPNWSALLFLLVSAISFAQDWNSITPIPSAGRDDGVAFSLNGFGFVVTGTADGSDYSEGNRLFCYNPENDSWIEKAYFPGIKRQYSSVFSIEEITYLIGGYSESGTALNDVWSYNGSQDTWTQMNNFPGLPRWDASSTSLNGFGYFGLGTTADSTLSDLWKYNPKKDEWTKICNYLGGDLRSVLSFPILNNIIFGEGFSVNPIIYSDKWFSFNTNDNSWQELDSPIEFRAYGTALSNGISAIICGGIDQNGTFYNNCYQLDYTEKWIETDSLGDEGIKGSSGFVIGNHFYVGTGIKASGFKTSEVYKLGSSEINLIETVVFPNPSNSSFNVISSPESKISIYSVEGKLLLNTAADICGYLRIDTLTSGIFIVKIENDDKQANFVIEKL